MIKQILKRLMPLAIWEPARLWYRQWQNHRTLARFSRREVEHTYAHHRLRVLIADPVADDWYDRDWPDMPEVDLLAHNRLRAGARVFNIGAHQGVVALILARTVGPAGWVVAVDPHPLNIEVAEKNSILNRVDNLIFRQAAGGARPGVVRMGFVTNDRVRGDERKAGTYTVQVVTIDQLAAEYGPPDVLFVDVEGFESMVLDGSAGVRSKGRNDWFVEVHVNHGLEEFGKTPVDILSYFPEPDYELLVGSDAERQFRPLDAARHLLADRFYLIALDRRPQPPSEEANQRPPSAPTDARVT